MVTLFSVYNFSYLIKKKLLKPLTKCNPILLMLMGTPKTVVGVLFVSTYCKLLAKTNALIVKVEYLEKGNLGKPLNGKLFESYKYFYLIPDTRLSRFC